MNRIHLYRGKRLDNGQFIEGSLIGEDVIVGKIVDFEEDYFTTEFWYKVVPETVGQFTGITDIHGRKVFEGDILSCKKADGASFEYKCVYNDENACFYFTNTKYGLSLSGDEMLYFDVIGNIHDLNLQL